MPESTATNAVCYTTSRDTIDNSARRHISRSETGYDLCTTCDIEHRFS
ncbi:MULTISPECIES: hypothetical protein [Sinorhizobium]|uniref:Uncharacterized protein n=2 Tax=Rhizobium fredii TaxID=380 RepID=I3XGZ8_SINF2|nr:MULTISPECIES: hypothetical protein [Sinorhizobium]AFL55154.1 hypothetical protein USDA257_p04390 [Sinorhizobium fredii USDA 257]AWI62220.1 hypothetical protein AB395_00006597 [Sinorhizobium fredii CCBAU 45436]MQX07534.1 hypothetical protein [Sinorhizobium fredii]